MFVRNRLDGAQRVGPPGCTPLRDDDRMPVVKVLSGDTWTISGAFVAADGGPATPKNSRFEFVLSENQFSPPLWTGGWHDGAIPDANRPGLVHVRIPRDLTKTLRRGSYMFSARVGDRTGFSFSTQLVGNFLVEYMPTSEQRSIPYRDGTSDIFGGGCSVDDISSAEDGIIRVLDEETGLYHKVSAFKTVDGKVRLGVYQEGVKAGGFPVRVLDEETGLYHKVVACKMDDGRVRLGVYLEGVKAGDFPSSEDCSNMMVRNETTGLLHGVEAVTVDGKVRVGIRQSGVVR